MLTEKEKKKSTALKLRVMFYLMILLRTVAQIALRYYFKEVRGMPEYIGVFAKEKHKYIVEHQKIPTHHTHTHTHTHTHKTDISS